jgi:transposase
VLVHKRLEGCKFVWPQVRCGYMFAALFEGLDWRLVLKAAAGRSLRDRVITVAQ